MTIFAADPIQGVHLVTGGLDLVPPTPSGASPSPAQQQIDTISDSCRQGMACPWFYEIFEKTAWGALAGTIVDVLLIVLIALILRKIAHRLITKFATRTAATTLTGRFRDKPDNSPDASIVAERRRQRAETVGSVLRSVASIIILGTAVLMILGRLGLNLAPVLASVGFIGIAVGFGAQTLVKDFIAGLFMLLEDQYGVGDWIDTGEASGTVEAVSLRITRLRDSNGIVWYVRNGEIIRVGNESMGWSQAMVDFTVAYDADIERAQQIIKAAADKMWRDPAYRGKVLEEPNLWGIQDMSSEAVNVRITLRTAPLEQWAIGRELRARAKRDLDAAGIEVGSRFWKGFPG